MFSFRMHLTDSWMRDIEFENDYSRIAHCNENPTYVYPFLGIARPQPQFLLSPDILFLGIFVSKFRYFVFAVR